MKEKRYKSNMWQNFYILFMFISIFSVWGNAIEINTSILTENDDVEERPSGRMAQGSSDLEMVDDSGDQTIGLRFVNLDIPQGATITSAYIQFTVDERDSEDTLLNIQAENIGNAPEFSTEDEDLTSRSRTTASVSWSVPVWDETKVSGENQKTPDLKDIVQEVVNLNSWESNNSMLFIIDGSGKRVADSYEGGEDRAAKLHIEYDITNDDNSSDGEEQNSTEKMKVLIPLYIYPDEDSWQGVIDAKNNNPEAEIIAIVNPSNGHFDSESEAYETYIPTLVDAGIKVVGYVYTQYGDRDIDEVKEDMEHWKEFYQDEGVTGIFFDETSSHSSEVSHYKELTSYANSLGFETTILNSGITIDTEYFTENVADIIVTYEESYENWQEDFQTGEVGYNHPDENTEIAMLIHTTSSIENMKEVVEESQKDGFAYLYITNDGGSNPWDTTPSYFDSEVKELLKYTVADYKNEENETSTTKSILQSISSGDDDVEEQGGDGSIYSDSSDLELVHEGEDQTIGLRFNELNIPQGATITSAYIQFTVDESDHTETTLLNIYAQNSDNAPAFSSADFDVSSRTKTTASVSWDVPIWESNNESSEAQKTPNLKDVVQEVITRQGWQNGASMVFIIEGSGKRVADSYEGGAEKAPKLFVEYVVEDSNKTTFVEDSQANILNPDRGLYSADYALDEETDYNIFEDPYNDGYRMVYAPINLYDYRETATLPSSLIDTIDGHLSDAESKGVKLILRLKYRPNASTDYHDPQLDIIMGHMEQLRDTLQNHKEIISVIQAGAIGAWGEWNRLTDEFADTNSDYKSNRRDIIEKLSDIFPKKYIQIRTPMHKELLYGTSSDYGDEGTGGMITEDIAYSDDIRAKIGHHNDCLMVDDTNYGTYDSNNIEFWKDYVANDTKFTVAGGETCGIESGFEELTDCVNVIPEFKRLHYSYLNNVYHEDVLQKWRDQGCYQEIKENLGYRLVAKELTIQKSEDNRTLDLNLSIENRGFASPYVNSAVSFILKNEEHTYTFAQSSIDIRKFYSQESYNILANLSITDIPTGNYTLYMKIGDGFSAIRLSNSKNSDGDEVWDETFKINRLKSDIKL